MLVAQLSVLQHLGVGLIDLSDFRLHFLHLFLFVSDKGLSIGITDLGTSYMDHSVTYVGLQLFPGRLFILSHGFLCRNLLHQSNLFLLQLENAFELASDSLLRFLYLILVVLGCVLPAHPVLLHFVVHLLVFLQCMVHLFIFLLNEGHILADLCLLLLD